MAAEEPFERYRVAVRREGLNPFTSGSTPLTLDEVSVVGRTEKCTLSSSPGEHTSMAACRGRMSAFYWVIHGIPRITLWCTGPT